MKKLLIGAISVLVIVHIVIGLFFLTNYYDWNNALNINPSDSVQTKYMALDCPPSGPSGPMVIFTKNFTMTNITLSVDVILSYNGTLAEGTPVELAAIGALYPDGQQTVSGVSVGFGGSTFLNAESNIPAQFTPPLQNASALQMYTDAPVLGTISWETQGDYYPFIILDFKNGSAPGTINYPEPEHKIHVESFDVIRQQNDSRRSIGIETSIFLIGCFDIPTSIAGYWSKMKRTNEENSNATQSNAKNQSQHRKKGQKHAAKEHRKHKG